MKVTLNGYETENPLSFCQKTVFYTQCEINYVVGFDNFCPGTMTEGGKPCYLPFDYEGVTYKECTTVANRGRLWCYTDKEGKDWRNCVGEKGNRNCCSL